VNDKLRLAAQYSDYNGDGLVKYEDLVHEITNNFDTNSKSKSH
jgi:hypothetical protein